jgi:hypothetical protein
LLGVSRRDKGIIHFLIIISSLTGGLKPTELLPGFSLQGTLKSKATD